MDVQKKKGSKRVDVQKKGRFRVQGVEAPLQMDTSVEALDDALVLVLGVVSAVTRSVTKDERKRAWGHAEAALQQPLVYKIETADVAGGFLAEWVEGMLGHRLYQHPDKIDDEAHCVKMVEHEQWTAVKEQAMRLEQQVRTARATPAALKHQLLAHGLVPVALQYGRNGAPKVPLERPWGRGSLHPDVMTRLGKMLTARFETSDRAQMAFDLFVDRFGRFHEPGTERQHAINVFIGARLSPLLDAFAQELEAYVQTKVFAVAHADLKEPGWWQNKLTVFLSQFNKAAQGARRLLIRKADIVASGQVTLLPKPVAPPPAVQAVKQEVAEEDGPIMPDPFPVVFDPQPQKPPAAPKEPPVAPVETSLPPLPLALCPSRPSEPSSAPPAAGPQDEDGRHSLTPDPTSAAVASPLAHQAPAAGEGAAAGAAPPPAADGADAADHPNPPDNAADGAGADVAGGPPRDPRVAVKGQPVGEGGASRLTVQIQWRGSEPSDTPLLTTEREATATAGDLVPDVLQHFAADVDDPHASGERVRMVARTTRQWLDEAAPLAAHADDNRVVVVLVNYACNPDKMTLKRRSGSFNVGYFWRHEKVGDVEEFLTQQLALAPENVVVGGIPTRAPRSLATFWVGNEVMSMVSLRDGLVLQETSGLPLPPPRQPPVVLDRSGRPRPLVPGRHAVPMRPLVPGRPRPAVPMRPLVPARPRSAVPMRLFQRRTSRADPTADRKLGAGPDPSLPVARPDPRLPGASIDKPINLMDSTDDEAEEEEEEEAASAARPPAPVLPAGFSQPAPAPELPADFSQDEDEQVMPPLDGEQGGWSVKQDLWDLGILRSEEELEQVMDTWPRVPPLAMEDVDAKYQGDHLTARNLLEFLQEINSEHHDRRRASVVFATCKVTVQVVRLLLFEQRLISEDVARRFLFYGEVWVLVIRSLLDDTREKLYDRVLGAPFELLRHVLDGTCFKNKRQDYWVACLGLMWALQSGGKFTFSNTATRQRRTLLFRATFAMFEDAPRYDRSKPFCGLGREFFRSGVTSVWTEEVTLSVVTRLARIGPGEWNSRCSKLLAVLKNEWAKYKTGDPFLCRIDSKGRRKAVNMDKAYARVSEQLLLWLAVHMATYGLPFEVAASEAPVNMLQMEVALDYDHRRETVFWRRKQNWQPLGEAAVFFLLFHTAVTDVFLNLKQLPPPPKNGGRAAGRTSAFCRRRKSTCTCSTACAP